jgi:hypothetical protein
MINVVIVVANAIIIFVVAISRFETGQLDAVNLARLRLGGLECVDVELALPDVAGLNNGLAWLAEQ